MTLKLEVAVADTAQCKKDLTIEVAADEVQAQFNKAYDAYMRYAKVPGFRPGHAPRGVVKQRFGKDIKDEVLGELLPHALQHAISDHKLRVVGSPEINDLSFNEGEPLRFKASVEILPEFELNEYKGIKAVKRVARVADEDVARTLEQLREGWAQLIPVEDRSAAAGDYVSVNLTGKYVEPPEEEDLRAEDVVIELGAENVQPEFNEHLQGVKAGEVREFRVVYPPDFNAKGLAGKTLDFTATVVAVRMKELPELDDDFAKEVGEFQTLAELRQKLREDLEHNAGQQAELRLRDELLERLTSAYDFPVPDTLVEKRAQERLSELLYTLMRSGVSPQDAKQINWEERAAEERLRAVREVRSALIIGRIAEAERIEVSEADMNGEIARVAEAARAPVEETLTRLTKDGGLASIENRLRFQKALDVVVKSADVTIEEFTENQETTQAADDAAEPAEHRSAEPA
jgi:trigger factor